MLLGRSTHDLDVIVPEGGIRLARAVANAFGGASFVLDEERNVGRAILHDSTGAVLEVDVARLRLPALLDDLSLRDFTVNAMAAEIGAEAHGLEVIDPFGGRADLDRRLIRAVTESSFRDDPLRTLRAVRQSIELGFQIEDATVNLIRRDAPMLASVSAERIRDELLRVIPAPGSWRHVRLLADLDLLPYILPESAAQIGVAQTTPHYQDVFDHTCSVIGHLEGILALLWPDVYSRPQPRTEDATIIAVEGRWYEVGELLAPYADDLRAHLMQPLAAGRLRRDWLFWAALAHDWGKPAMRSIDEDERAHFYEHDQWGAMLVGHRGTELKLAADEIAYLSRLVNEHMRPGYLAHDFPPSRRAIYRFYRDAGDSGPECALLSLADSMATHAAEPLPANWRQHLGATELMLRAFFRDHAGQVAPAPLLNGHQLMTDLGLKPGPVVGKLLDDLREAQAVGEVSTVDAARVWLAKRLRAVSGASC
jgi:tRNA nucleotidyltransferase/poly(A) polymerase